MAATDKLDRVTDSSTGRPVIAKLGANKAIGAATHTLNTATNWTTSSKIHYSIYNVTANGVKDMNSQTDWEGTLTGTTINSPVLTGGTDQAYTTAAYVEITPTAKYAKDLYDHLLTQHKQDGSHADVITTNAINENTAANGVTIDGLNIKDNKLNTDASVIPTNLQAGTGTSWAWQAYTPTWTAAGTAPSLGNGTLTGAYTQIGKTVHFRLKFVAGSTTTFGTSGWRFTLPVACIAAEFTPPSNPGSSPATSIGSWYGENPGAAGYSGLIALLTGTTFVLHVQGITNAGLQSQANSTNPNTWANTWYFMASGTYEAA
jgi:hypothetical protein